MQKQPLKKVHEIFWKLITAPEGVEEGLRQFPEIQIEDWFKGDEKLSPTRRLNIYANMYFWRIHDAIKEDYPEVFEKIGEKNWNNLMTDYLLRHPSDTPYLQYVGKYLPIFLKESPLSQKWPELYDLALLEWEKAMLFEAKEASTISIEDLQKIDIAKWPHLRFEFVPAFKLIETSKKDCIRIWRKDHAVFHKIISKEESVALNEALAKKPFSDICEKIGDAEKAARFLADWVEGGLIQKMLL